MPGHTSALITKQHDIEPDEKVNPVTAEILESLPPQARTGEEAMVEIAPKRSRPGRRLMRLGSETTATSGAPSSGTGTAHVGPDGWRGPLRARVCPTRV
jgi:hypothetical protein